MYHAPLVTMAMTITSLHRNGVVYISYRVRSAVAMYRGVYVGRLLLIYSTKRNARMTVGKGHRRREVFPTLSSYKPEGYDV